MMLAAITDGTTGAASDQASFIIPLGWCAAELLHTRKGQMAASG